MDEKTNLLELKNLIERFCAERDWDQFHAPKELAIGLSTEAAELLELFRFKSESEIEILMQQEPFREKVRQELADAFFFVLRFAQKSKIDLSCALRSKMEINAAKYPVETAKGSNKKYGE